MPTPKIKINKQNLNDIEQLRLFAKSHQDSEDCLFERIASSMGITDEDEKNKLWDFIYHDSRWLVELQETKES